MSVIEELGNTYLEDTTDLLVLDTKDIESVSVIHSVQNVQKVGKEALESLVKERLIERKKPLVDVVPATSCLYLAILQQKTSRQTNKR